MAENKTRPTKSSVNGFINLLTDETRRADARTLVKLMQNATGEKPAMWGPAIIGFGSYHYVYDSGREFAVGSGGYELTFSNVSSGDSDNAI